MSRRKTSNYAIRTPVEYTFQISDLYSHHWSTHTYCAQKVVAQSLLVDVYTHRADCTVIVGQYTHLAELQSNSNGCMSSPGTADRCHYSRHCIGHTTALALAVHFVHSPGIFVHFENSSERTGAITRSTNDHKYGHIVSIRSRQSRP